MSSLMEEVDVRAMAPHERHARLFDRFDGLLPGEVQWTYLQDGPDLWRVQIGRQQASCADAGGDCCSGGACGGG